MNKDQLILAIDQGGQSSRVAVYTITGDLLHSFSTACETTRKIVDGNEYIEQDPVEIIAGICSCLAKLESMIGEYVTRISAAGFAGQGSSLLCWNKNTGEALSPVLSWQDIRGKDYLTNIQLTHEQTQKITGLRVSPHYGASKIKWCLENNAEVMQAQQQGNLIISPISTYIFWHLSNGEINNFIDPGHAQRTLLWDMKLNNWSDNLLELFKIPKSILPQCLYHNSKFGHLYLDGHKIPFTSSARDQGASLFARGQPDKTACYINLGTGAFIQRITDNLQAPEGLLVSPLWFPEPVEQTETFSPVCYQSESKTNNLYAWEATVNGAAAALPFVREQTQLQITPDEITQALKLAEPKGYFLNAIGGLSAPYWRTDLQSKFNEGLTPQQKIHTWLESIIFQCVVNVNLMNADGSLKAIYISGGLSQADGICQRFADLTGLQVIRSENADATLQGIANMAGGLRSAWVPQSTDDIFEPQENLLLKKRFEEWNRAMAVWLTGSIR